MASTSDYGMTRNGGSLMVHGEGECDRPGCEQEASWLMGGAARCGEHRDVPRDEQDPGAGE